MSDEPDEPDEPDEEAHLERLGAHHGILLHEPPGDDEADGYDEAVRDTVARREAFLRGFGLDDRDTPNGNEQRRQLLKELIADLFCPQGTYPADGRDEALHASAWTLFHELAFRRVTHVRSNERRADLDAATAACVDVMQGLLVAIDRAERCDGDASDPDPEDEAFFARSRSFFKLVTEAGLTMTTERAARCFFLECLIGPASFTDDFLLEKSRALVELTAAIMGAEGLDETRLQVTRGSMARGRFHHRWPQYSRLLTLADYEEAVALLRNDGAWGDKKRWAALAAIVVKGGMGARVDAGSLYADARKLKIRQPEK